MHLKPIEIILLIYLCASLAIFLSIGEFSVVIFTVLWGGFGFILYILTEKISFRKSLKAFVLTAFSASVAEEVLCYITGGTLAIYPPWKDFIVIPTVFLSGFLVWWFWEGERYRFEYRERVFLFGITGILYEGVPALITLSINPLGFVLMLPIIIVVYASIAIVPMRFIKEGEVKPSISAKICAVILPWLGGTATYIFLSLLIPGL